MSRSAASSCSGRQPTASTCSAASRSPMNARNVVGTSTSCPGRDDHPDLVPGPHLAAGHDRQVGAGSRLGGERLHPPPDAHPRGEGRAGDPRAGDLEHHLVADRPPVADQGGVDVETERGEVLAERPVGELDAESALPGVQLLAGERVHRLEVAAVVPDVADEVVDQAAAEPAALGSGCPQGGGVDRALADARDSHGLGRVGLPGPEVDGGDVSGHGSSLGGGPR